MSEPGTGSDLQNVKTKAIRDGEQYVVSRSKAFITNGGQADRIPNLANVCGQLGAENLRRHQRNHEGGDCTDPLMGHCRAAGADSTSTRVAIGH
jgi:hypothetical protein